MGNKGYPSRAEREDPPNWDLGDETTWNNEPTFTRPPPTRTRLTRVNRVRDRRRNQRNNRRRRTVENVVIVGGGGPPPPPNVFEGEPVPNAPPNPGFNQRNLNYNRKYTPNEPMYNFGGSGDPPPPPVNIFDNGHKNRGYRVKKGFEIDHRKSYQEDDWYPAKNVPRSVGDLKLTYQEERQVLKDFKQRCEWVREEKEREEILVSLFYRRNFKKFFGDLEKNEEKVELNEEIGKFESVYVILFNLYLELTNQIYFQLEEEVEEEEIDDDDDEEEEGDDGTGTGKLFRDIRKGNFKLRKVNTTNRGGGRGALFRDIQRGNFQLKKVRRAQMKRPKSPKTRYRDAMGHQPRGRTGGGRGGMMAELMRAMRTRREGLTGRTEPRNTINMYGGNTNTNTNTTTTTRSGHTIYARKTGENIRKASIIKKEDISTLYQIFRGLNLKELAYYLCRMVLLWELPTNIERATKDLEFFMDLFLSSFKKFEVGFINSIFGEGGGENTAIQFLSPLTYASFNVIRSFKGNWEKKKKLIVEMADKKYPKIKNDIETLFFVHEANENRFQGLKDYREFGGMSDLETYVSNIVRSLYVDLVVINELDINLTKKEEGYVDYVEGPNMNLTCKNDDLEIGVHKSICVMKSNFFFLLFKSEWAETTKDKTEIEILNSIELYCFVEFIYTDNINVRKLQEKFDIQSSDVIKVLLRLLSFSIQFFEVKLKNTCLNLILPLFSRDRNELKKEIEENFVYIYKELPEDVHKVFIKGWENVIPNFDLKRHIEVTFIKIEKDTEIEFLKRELLKKSEEINELKEDNKRLKKLAGEEVEDKEDETDEKSKIIDEQEQQIQKVEDGTSVTEEDQ